jgi:phosphatidylinositol alpha-1,6-mannosyltransferase
VGTVLALVTEAVGGEGGIAQYNRDFFSALRACEAVSSIAVLSRRAPAASAVFGKIDQGRGRIAYVVAALCEAFRRRPDVVFCGHLHMAPLAAAIARLRRAKLILQLHGIEAWLPPSRPRRAAVEAADLVLCVSRHTRSAVLGWAAIAPERVLVVPNTVADAFSPGDGAALRTALALDGKRVLLTVGRMASAERYKGHDRVVRAIPDLVRQGQDVVYAMIGGGDDRRRLEELAQTLGVAERVRFLGARPRETVAAAYRMADLYVMPSTGEGFGIAYLEAMASGTPALGLDAAGARDALADGELGTLVSEAELGAAIARLLGAAKPDPRALAAATRARFGRAAFVRSVHAALARLVSDGSRRELMA